MWWHTSLQCCCIFCRTPTCTLYAVEALQALAKTPGPKAYLKQIAVDWGPALWRLMLAEPEGEDYWVRDWSYLALCYCCMYDPKSGLLSPCNAGVQSHPWHNVKVMLGHERDMPIVGSGAACRLPCYGVQVRNGDEGKLSFH